MKTEKKTPAKAQTKATSDIIDLTNSSDAESMDAEAIPLPAAREGVTSLPAPLMSYIKNVAFFLAGFTDGCQAAVPGR